MSEVFKASALAVFGLAEGYTFAKSGVVAPQSFRGQMEFQSWTIMKVFLSAVGFSMVAQSAMARWDRATWERTRFYTYSQVGFRRAMGGCFVLGNGMYISGSGPTMIAAQIGSSTGGAWFVLGGALLGAFVYGLIEQHLFPDPVAAVPDATREETSLDGKIGVPYENVALPAGVSLLGATVMLEKVFPHSADLALLGSFKMPSALLPITAGAAVGLNQIPIRHITADGQGGSTCLMNLVSTASWGKISPRHFIRRVADSYQFVYLYVGTSLGAYLATQYTEGYVPAEALPISNTVIGAAMMVLGARYANGCTCGHGISGMSELSITSIAGACSIFAGGISAGVINNLFFKSSPTATTSA